MEISPEFENNIIASDFYKFESSLAVLNSIEKIKDVKLLRKEVNLLFLIKSDPYQSVKYYTSKSGFSARWVHVVLHQLISNGLVKIEVCKKDSRSRVIY